MEVVEYRLSVGLGFCLTADELVEISVNEKQAWSGSASDNTVLNINRPDLFGGQKKEGGLVGNIHVLFGGEDQVLPQEIAARHGLSVADAPAYRGLTTLWFVGSGESSGGFAGTSFFNTLIDGIDNIAVGTRNTRGFLWSMNSPIIAQNVWARFRRKPKTTLDQTHAIVETDGRKDANPAHWIWELLTDPGFGMGGDPALLDAAAFEAAAETLFNENFGVSFVWLRQTTVEAMVKEMLDLIQASVFLHPRTGLLTLKLFRDDYDIETLKHISPVNATLRNYKKRSFGEATNQITASWTDPVNEQESTLTVHDLASAEIQGPVATTLDYYPIRNAQLAGELAARDMRAVSALLDSADVELDRSFWDVEPGEPVLLTWPEYGIESAVVRFGRVDYGRAGDGKIKSSVLQDLWSLEKTPTVIAPPTGWEDPSVPPADADAVRVFTLPAYFTFNASLQQSPVDLSEPEVLAGVLAHVEDMDGFDYELAADETSPGGETIAVSKGAKTLIDLAVLEDAIPAEAVTVLPITLWTDIDFAPKVGGFVLLGTTDTAQELCLVTAADEDGWTVARGVLDTVPQAWAAGTPAWAINPGVKIADEQTVWAPGATASYKVLPRTSQGTLDPDDATPATAVMTERPWLPLRPANVALNGVSFGDIDVTAGGDIIVTWATRNRLTEDSQVLSWTDGPVAPEFRQETVVSVYDETDALVFEQGGLWTENELTLAKADFDAYESLRIEVWSRRDDYESLQRYRAEVTGLAGDVEVDPPGPPTPPVRPPRPWIPGPGPDTFDVDVLLGENPGFRIIGEQDLPEATSLSVQVRVGAGDWQDASLIALDRLPIDSPVLAAPETTYTPRIAYVVGGIVGEYTELDPVTTGALDVSPGSDTRTDIEDLFDVFGDTETAGESAAAAAVSAALAADSQIAAAANQAAAAASESAAIAAEADAIIAQGAAQAAAADAAAEALAAASSATGASGSAASASASASAAIAAEADAIIAQGAAEAAASDAAADALAAASSASGALTSANSASTSATNASTSATTAAGHASSASTSAGAAATSATNAGNSATAAAGSATSASTSATNAGNSATAASASAVSAQSVANRLLPDRPSIAADFITSSSGFPDAAAPLSVGTVVAVAGEGDVREFTSRVYMYTRGWLPVGADRTIRGTIRARVTADGVDNRIVAGIATLAADGSYLGAVGHGYLDSAWVAADGWQSWVLTTTSAAILAEYPTTAYVRLYINGARTVSTSVYSGATWQLAVLRLQDITSEAAAGASATAAATSASSAATSATAAGTSASAASTSATNAATSAGAASTSATNASNSATTASGHASSASTSATAAANSASAASGSASAAAGSASSASTAATNAGNSATAASASAVSAQSVANRLIPDRPAVAADFVSSASVGAPQTATPTAIGVVVTVSGEGDVREFSGWSSIYTRGGLAVGTDRTFRLEARQRTTVDGTNNRFYRAISVFDSSWGYLGDVLTTLTAQVVSDGWQTAVLTTSSTALLAAYPTAAHIRARVRPGSSNAGVSSGATTQVSFIRLQDITSEAAAGSSATAAATSASSAATSATAAGTSASAASTSATNAATSAGAASTSATNASTSATTAAGHASSASTSATAAANSASAASGSATAAAGSASSASTSATNAGNSATAASASAVSAQSVANRLIPTQVAVTADWMGLTTSGTPESAPAASGFGSSSVVTDSERGQVRRFTGPGSGATRGWLPVVSGRTYRISMWYAVPVAGAGGNRSRIGFRVWTADGTYISSTVGGVTVVPTVAAGWAELTSTITGATILAAYPTAAYVRASFVVNELGTPGTVDVASVRFEDITSEAAAGASATAAATSASSAATSATAAGTSASAASTSATNAATSAGAASTSATNASNSATTASGHASTASTAATAAAASQLAAGNSATAAGTSATNAATSATAAGNSATAAAASAVSAESAYTAAVLVSGDGDFSQGVTGWSQTSAFNPDVTPIPPSEWTAEASYQGRSGVLLSTVGVRRHLTTRRGWSVDPARKYRIRTRFYIGGSTGQNRMYIGFLGLDADGVAVGSNSGRRYAAQNGVLYASGAGWVEVLSPVITGTGSGTHNLESGVTQIALLAYVNYDNNADTFTAFDELALLDVTESEAAAASASAAATSASSAATSATAAGTSASAASTSATNAATSAGAAGTSATNASNSATTAAGHASSASTSATAAANSASAASGSASAAAGSASSASTSATNAGNSATAASASAVTAQSVANRMIPERASVTADFGGSFSSNGSPETYPALTWGSVVAVAGEGDVREFTASGTYRDLVTRGGLNVVSGRTYRMTHRTRVTVDGGGTNRTLAYWRMWDASWNYLGVLSAASSAMDTSHVAADGWQNLTADVTGAALLAAQPNAAYVRADLRLGENGAGSGSGATIQVAFLRLQDVTSEAAAGTSASAAATSASSAATSATNAGTSASAASASATTAATQATNAGTSASSASTSASNAASSASTAATHASTAGGHATTATTQASNATTSAAAAATSASLAASIGTGALYPNAAFSNFPSSGNPVGWVSWSTPTITRQAGQVSSYAMRIAAAGGVQAGAYVDYTAGGLVDVRPGYYVIEADATLVSGSLTSAGVLLQPWDASASLTNTISLIFATDADTNGDVPGAGTTGRTYRWRKLVEISSPTSIKARVFAMAHFSTFGSTAAANSIDFHRVAVRPATPEEILANTALPPLQATVATHSSVLVTLEGVAYAAHGFLLDVNGHIAGMTSYNDGDTSEIVFQSDVFEVRNSDGSTAIEKDTAGDVVIHGDFINDSVLSFLSSAYGLRVVCDWATQVITITAQAARLVPHSGDGKDVVLTSISETVSWATTVGQAGGRMQTKNHLWWGAIWLISNADGSTVSAIWDESFTSPTMPSGYTHRSATPVSEARVIDYASGTGPTATAFVPFVQNGDDIVFTETGGGSASDGRLLFTGSPALGNNSTPTYYALQVRSDGTTNTYPYPPTAKQIVMLPQRRNGVLAIAPNNNYGNVDNTAKPPPYANQADSTITQFTMTLESDTIYVIATHGEARAHAFGYRRRM